MLCCVITVSSASFGFSPLFFQSTSEPAMKMLEKEGFRVTYLPVDREGKMFLDQFKEAIEEHIKRISIMHGNNEI